MPDGKTHGKLWGIAAPLPIATAAYQTYHGSWISGAGVIAGYMLGRWIDPDLDQMGITSAEWRSVRECGFVGVLITMYFMPYAYVIPHRSFFSHAPVVGTVIRVAYMAIPFVILAIVFKWTPSDHMIIFGISTFVGLAISDLVHITADALIK